MFLLLLCMFSFKLHYYVLVIPFYPFISFPTKLSNVVLLCANLRPMQQTVVSVSHDQLDYTINKQKLESVSHIIDHCQINTNRENRVTEKFNSILWDSQVARPIDLYNKIVWAIFSLPRNLAELGLSGTTNKTMSDLGQMWIRLERNETNQGLFKISFWYFLACWAKM